MTYQFEIKNTGDTELVIADMTSETGDFKFECPKKPLKPHKKELIFITYTPKDPTVVGSFKSAVLITSNATPQPYPFIHLSGTVLPTKDASASPKTQQSGARLLRAKLPNTTQLLPLNSLFFCLLPPAYAE